MQVDEVLAQARDSMTVQRVFGEPDRTERHHRHPGGERHGRWRRRLRRLARAGHGQRRRLRRPGDAGRCLRHPRRHGQVGAGDRHGSGHPRRPARGDRRAARRCGASSSAADDPAAVTGAASDSAIRIVSSRPRADSIRQVVVPSDQSSASRDPATRVVDRAAGRPCRRRRRAGCAEIQKPGIPSTVDLLDGRPVVDDLAEELLLDRPVEGHQDQADPRVERRPGGRVGPPRPGRPGRPGGGRPRPRRAGPSSGSVGRAIGRPAAASSSSSGTWRPSPSPVPGTPGGQGRAGGRASVAASRPAPPRMRRRPGRPRPTAPATAARASRATSARTRARETGRPHQPRRPGARDRPWVAGDDRDADPSWRGRESWSSGRPVDGGGHGAQGPDEGRRRPWRAAARRSSCGLPELGTGAAPAPVRCAT